MSIRFSGVILKCCKPDIATDASKSSSNSTKDIPSLPGTIRTSLNPGYCWNSIESIISLQRAGRFSTNNILFGALGTGCCGLNGWVTSSAFFPSFGFFWWFFDRFFVFVFSFPFFHRFPWYPWTIQFS